MKFIEDLENILHIPDTSYGKYHKDSIMQYDVVCDCDPNYMCEHRTKWVIDYLNYNIRKEKINSL